MRVNWVVYSIEMFTWQATFCFKKKAVWIDQLIGGIEFVAIPGVSTGRFALLKCLHNRPHSVFIKDYVNEWFDSMKLIFCHSSHINHMVYSVELSKLQTTFWSQNRLCE